ncbi:methylosome subunit pICln-like [Octopus vulgaris]|uniref:Methylosome subunit pICln-like n=2 Tax=Octopus TaxID=6643 RepID=A0AA36EXK7_OCTVU|nr:methylosome subunit pICln [Octopus sinensis]CAI9716797.1 methylosome subunit pICln-like [Octopus vulgaris]
MVKLTNFPPPTEGIHCEQPDVEVFVQKKSLGLGKLYVAESRLSWVGYEDNKGFSIEYPAISVHGVSKDQSSFPRPCIYMIINCLLDDDDTNNENQSEDDDDDDLTEIHLVPQDSGTLNLIFQTLSTCSALHPDENQLIDSEFEDVDEEDETDEIVDYEESANSLSNLSIRGQETLQHLENIFVDSSHSTNGVLTSEENQNEEQPMESGQFDDADI